MNEFSLSYKTCTSCKLTKMCALSFPVSSNVCRDCIKFFASKRKKEIKCDQKMGWKNRRFMI